MLTLHLQATNQIIPSGEFHLKNHLLGFRTKSAAPIAERSKLPNDLGRGWGDPGSNLGGGMFFRDGELS